LLLNRYIWESKADGNFAITEDTENEPLGRGTEIRIYLKSDAAEYAQEDKLRVRFSSLTFLLHASSVNQCDFMNQERTHSSFILDGARGCRKRQYEVDHCVYIMQQNKFSFG